MPADGVQAQTVNSDSAPRVLCAGIIVLDEVFRVDEFPRNDGKVEAEAFFAVNGGCAANAAVAVARLGGRATLAGPLGGPAGMDENGDRVLAALSREAIDISACQRVEGLKTALSAIFINARGERTIVTYRDPRIAAVTPADPEALTGRADIVLADNRFPQFVRPICEAARFARGARCRQDDGARRSAVWRRDARDLFRRVSVGDHRAARPRRRAAGRRAAYRRFPRGQ
jgi:sugar/nucleoside kinase (ribokinase family)